MRFSSIGRRRRAGIGLAAYGFATRGSGKSAPVLQIDEVNGRVGKVVLRETRQNGRRRPGQDPDPNRPLPFPARGLVTMPVTPGTVLPVLSAPPDRAA